MNKQVAGKRNFDEVIDEFIKVAKADEDAADETLIQLSSLFQRAVEKKKQVLKIDNMKANFEDIVLAVANQISLKSGERFKVHNEYGRPAWRMDSVADFHKWLQDYHGKSTCVKGAARWLMDHGK
ncbi:MAG: hypothetical protein AB8B83_08945 [Bdellovibrionales bacterium]